MVLFAGCADVKVTDVTMLHPAAGWAYWVMDCDRVAFDRAKVLADPDLPNNDGIHINASRDVSVSNCRVIAGDDAIVVRCNHRPHRSRENRPCERVTVANCQLTAHADGGVPAQVASGRRRLLVECPGRGLHRREGRPLRRLHL